MLEARAIHMALQEDECWLIQRLWSCMLAACASPSAANSMPSPAAKAGAGSGEELVRNGRFDNLEGWTEDGSPLLIGDIGGTLEVERRVVTVQRDEVAREPPSLYLVSTFGGVTFSGTVSPDRVANPGRSGGVHQNINRDVSGCGRLVLGADYKVVRTDVPLAGQGGTELPAVDVIGTRNGEHVNAMLGAVFPHDTRDNLPFGFLGLAMENFEKGKAEGSIHVVPRNQWTHLERELPRLDTVELVRARGNGWDYEAWVDNISLRCEKSSTQ